MADKSMSKRSSSTRSRGKESSFTSEQTDNLPIKIHSSRRSTTATPADLHPTTSTSTESTKKKRKCHNQQQTEKESNIINSTSYKSQSVPSSSLSATNANFSALDSNSATINSTRSQHKSKSTTIPANKKHSKNQKKSETKSRTNSSSSSSSSSLNLNSKKTGRIAKSKAIQALSKSTKSTKSSRNDDKPSSSSELIDNDIELAEDLDYQEDVEENIEEEHDVDNNEEDVQLEEELEEQTLDEQEEERSKHKRATKVSHRRRHSARLSVSSNRSDLDIGYKLRKSSTSNLSIESNSNHSPSVPKKKARLSTETFQSTYSSSIQPSTSSSITDNTNNTSDKSQRFSNWFENSNDSNSQSTFSVKSSSNKKETGTCISKPSLNTSSTTSPTTTPSQSNTSNRKRNQTSSSISTSKQASNNEQPPQQQQQQTTSASLLQDSKSVLSKLKTKTSLKMSQQQQQQDNTNKQTNSTTSNSAAAASGTTTTTTTAGLSGLVESSADSASDNDSANEFSRLTDLLQSRGLPSHIVNAFGSKVQQFLHRTMSSGMGSRSQQLINSLQQSDESIKLTALAELCQLLVMGNEDTLIGFPIKQLVPLLLQCMSSETENYDLMNHACRALTYMMEFLPRSSSIIADGIGIFLEKLQVIQCMDVAEQALTALEILSRRHSKQILNAPGSINSCLNYIDFFSISAQRNALQITSNCCQNMVKDEFVHIQSSLPILSQRLTHSDKKSVESVCTVFARLVENFQSDQQILKELASHNVLLNMQQLLILQPSLISTATFVSILHTIYLMCANCNELAIELIENNIAETIKFLLIGTKTSASSATTTTTTTTTTSANVPLSIQTQATNNNKSIEILNSRSPQELYEIVSICGEIMPRLPRTDIFAIDDILKKTSMQHQNEQVMWQWKDEHGVWRPYTRMDSGIIETAYNQEEDECVLNTMSRTYVIDFNSMVQINEETGTSKPVKRLLLHTNNSSATSNLNSEVTSANSKQHDEETKDHRLDYLNKKSDVYSQYVNSIFPIVYEVYSSSAGPSIKHRSLRTLLRLIYFSSSLKITVKNGDQSKQTANNCDSLLYNLLYNLPISSHIASMLASNDLKIVVSALQLCEILMQNLPQVFSVYFHREGVMHQIDKLIESTPIQPTLTTTPTTTTTTTTSTHVEMKVDETESTQQAKTRSSSHTAAPPQQQQQDFRHKLRNSSGKGNKQDEQQPVSNNTNNSSANTTAKYFRNIFSKGSSASSGANNKAGSNTATTLSSNSTQTVPSIASVSFAPFYNYNNFLHNANSSTTANAQQQRGASELLSNSRWFKSNTNTSGTNTNPLTQYPFFSTNSSIYQQANNLSLPPPPIPTNPNLSSSSSTSANTRISTSNSSKRKANQTAQSIDLHKGKVHEWIRDQAKRFKDQYFTNAKQTSESGVDVLDELKKALHELSKSNANYLDSFRKISDLLKESDISPFEMINSGLITTLCTALITTDVLSSSHSITMPTVGNAALYHDEVKRIVQNEASVLKCKQFLNSFCDLPLFYFGNEQLGQVKPADSTCFSLLISKVHNCINQQEQFAVRVHDVPNSIGCGKTAILFFNTNQLKCQLQRHSSASSPTQASTSAKSTQAKSQQHESLREWKGGHVKVDPLASVATIEKYLLMRGIYKPPSQLTSSTATSSGLFISTSLPESQRLQLTKSKSKSPSSRMSLSLKDNKKSLAVQMKAKSAKQTGKKQAKCVKRSDEGKKSAQTTKSKSSQKAAEDNKKRKSKKTSKSSERKYKTNEEGFRIDDNDNELKQENLEHDDDDDNDDDDDEHNDDEEFNEFHDLEGFYHDEENGDEEEEEDDDEESNENFEDAEQIIESEHDEDHDDEAQEAQEEDEEEDMDEDEDEIDDFVDDDDDEEDEDDEDDDDDIETAMNVILSSASGKSLFHHMPKIELLINEHVLPSNMTIYQAIKQYSMNNVEFEAENDNDLLNNAVWSKVHLIHYRLASTQSQTTSAELAKKVESKKETKKSSEETCNFNSNIANTLLFKQLVESKKNETAGVALNDKSIEPLTLLRTLSYLNRDWFLMYQDLFSLQALSVQLKPNQPAFLLSSSEFVNAKLAAKANRQLQDPLVIMTGHLPKWLPELMSSFPFIFPFETRLMYFYVSSLDRDRALQKLLDQNPDLNATTTSTNTQTNRNQRLTPKLDRKKRTVVRSNDLIKQADSILNDFVNLSAQDKPNRTKQAVLEIQYEDEVGSGLGPTLEFYALLSKEIQKCENEMWRGDKLKDPNKEDFYFYSSTGLFPAPIKATSSKQQNLITKLKSKFKFFGKFMAKALVDSRVLDIPLSMAFYKYLIDSQSLAYEDLKYVDEQLYRSLESLKDVLRKRRTLLLNAHKTNEFDAKLDEKLDELKKYVADLELDFTMPGYAQIELKKNGKDVLVTLENLDEYISSIVEWTLIKGVKLQFDSFVEGFELIMPITCLKQFYAEELDRLFCGAGFYEWDIKMLTECTRCDHGFTHESKAVKYLFQIMSSFNADEQRQFLQFITGSPRLPVGGLKSLVPLLTIVRKVVDSSASSSSSNPDNYLPSVMTCVNYLKLPDYSSIEIMREKLFKAMQDGQLSFHLS